jgi:peptidoglycan/LPS O-acetylase OafA/YrhL
LDARTESPNLDFLRSCAVLFVLFFHVMLYFQHTHFRRFEFGPIGHWGVIIFFIHTSLVLMFSMERHQLRSGGESLFGSFFARRIFRIYPLSILVVVVIALLRLPVGHLRSGNFMVVNLSWAGLLSNLALVQDLTHSESITAVLWSLPYEMRMYLFLPFVFLLARWIRSPLPIFLCWGLAVLLATQSAYFERHGASDFLIFVPCFLSGVVAYKLSSFPRLRLNAWLWPCALAVVTLIYLKHQTPVSSWLCSIILGLVLPQFQELSNPFLRKACLLVARYSYGIYLTHFIFIWLIFDRLHSLSIVLRIVLFVISASAVPVFLYHAIEEPAIRAGQELLLRLREKRPRTVVAVQAAGE